MTGPLQQRNKGPRTARGLPRSCRGCGQPFRPKNSKGKFCSEACKKARGRLEAWGGLGRVLDSEVARVPFRSKSPNNINGLSDHFAIPRAPAKTGWQIEGGELVFYPMPETQPFTEKERRRLGGGHMLLRTATEVAA